MNSQLPLITPNYKMALPLKINVDINRSHRIAVSTFFFIAGLVFSSWTSRIPDIKTQLGLNEAGLGTVLFALPVGLMCSLPLSGWLVSHLGSKRVMLIAASMYATVLITLGLATAVWQLVAGLFFFGLASNMCNIAVNTQAVGVEALYGRSIMASFHGLWSLAGFVAGSIGGLFAAKGIAPYLHFITVFVVAVLLILVAYKYALPEDGAPSEEKKPIFVKPDSNILKLGLIAFGSMACEGTMFDWSGVYFQNVVQVPKALVGFGFAAFMSTMAGGRFAADWLVTRLGVSRVLQGSGILIATGLIISVVFPYFYSATIGFLLVGIGVSSVVPLVYALAGRSKTMVPGMALAAVSTIGFLGFLIGPPLIGFIAQAASLRWSFTLIAIIGLATTMLASQTKKM